MWLQAAPAHAQAPPQLPGFTAAFVDNTLLYDPDSGDGAQTLRLQLHESTTPPGAPSASVRGWSFSVYSDPQYVYVTGVAVGAAVATINAGGPPAFFQVDILAEGFTVEAAYDLFGNLFTVHTTPLEVLRVDYASSGGMAGNTVGATLPLVWQPLGSPLVQNEITLGAGATVSVNTNNQIHLVPETRFLRGDGDGSGSISPIQDAVAILAYLFVGGLVPCLDAADVDDSGSVALADPVYLLAWGFNSGPQPAEPFPSCAGDSTADSIGCQVLPITCP